MFWQWEGKIIAWSGKTVLCVDLWLKHMIDCRQKCKSHQRPPSAAHVLLLWNSCNPKLLSLPLLLLGDLTRADWPKGWALLLVCQLLTQHTIKTNMERCVIIFFQMADCPLIIRFCWPSNIRIHSLGMCCSSLVYVIMVVVCWNSLFCTIPKQLRLCVKHEKCMGQLAACGDSQFSNLSSN